MAWTIEYAKAAKNQLHKLDKQIAKRILNYMSERIAPLSDPRQAGKALRGPRQGPVLTCGCGKPR